MRKEAPKTAKTKKSDEKKKPILKRAISKLMGRRNKKVEPNKGVISAKLKKKETVKDFLPDEAVTTTLQREKEAVEEAKFTTTKEAYFHETSPENLQYNLPVRYGDNRITIMPRDPWWLYGYWDISENRINEVISSIPIYERENLKWVLRVYDVTGIADFQGHNANSFFDIDIRFEANNWYINVNEPEKDWCVDIGLKNPMGKFFFVARSNVIKTPYFGISSSIDEEWALPDEQYYKVFGIYDLGRSSLERKQRFEEIIKKQVSSHMASGGLSSLFSEREHVKDKFFLEVWTELILYGRTEADAHVTVEGQKVDLRPDGTFSLRYALPVGDYKFEVVGTSKNKKHKIKKTPAVKRFEK